MMLEMMMMLAVRIIMMTMGDPWAIAADDDNVNTHQEEQWATVIVAMLMAAAMRTTETVNILTARCRKMKC